MTLIFGAEHKGKVYLVGDRFAGDEFLTDVCHSPKVFKIKIPYGKSDHLEMGVGFSGNFRIKTMIENSFIPPKMNKRDKAEEWMNKVFFKSFSEFLFSDPHFQGKTEMGSNLLIAFQGMLFVYQSDYSMLRMKNGFCAIGPADMAALCVFDVLKDNKTLDIEEKLIKTFESIKKFASCVREPFDLIEI
jgi:hypothetical protein